MSGLGRMVGGWLAAMALLAVAACGPIDDPGIASDVERELERGRSYATELTARGGEWPTPEEAIAAGYLERLRLGLGSPFRLMEHALQDPRLPKESRERLAWAILDRTLEGETYRIDPRALDQRDPAAATRHLTLVEGAIRGSADPDAGMLALRLGYTMAAAEGLVSEAFRDRISRVSALVRDRVQSQHDAARLLRAAGNDVDPLALLSVWRVERTFDVERPGTLAPTRTVERDAVARAPRLLASIREIRHRGAAPQSMPSEGSSSRSLLGPETARVLAETSRQYNAPPQTPVAIAVRTYGRLVPEAADDAARFFDNAVNEERLAAEYALLGYRTEEVPLPGRLAVLSAAVSLRAYAQERPWFPGFGGPATQDLEDRFGLASVTFPDGVPAEWRPYYRRMLEASLSDLRRVLPSLDVRGLNVRFEPRSGSPGTLAVHDPRTRTIHIPAVTGAGTIAHEVAHDIDWQTALRRYRVRGDYGSDRAVRLFDQQLTRVLDGLTAASLPERVRGEHSAHATRPAEVFARSVDWFVAVALAREGRMNGYLSSVQDDVLTGYGTVTPPDVSGGAGQALVALLDEVAPVYPDTRRWFLGRYGRLRAPTAYDLARRVMEAPLGDAPSEPEPPADLQPELEALLGDTLDADTLSDLLTRPGPARLSVAMGRLDRLEQIRDSVLAMVDGGCRGVVYDDGVDASHQRMVRLVAEARARGVALDAALALGGTRGKDWLAARFEGRTRDPAPTPVVVAMLTELADRVAEVGGGRSAGVGAAGALEVPLPRADCVPIPLSLD